MSNVTVLKREEDPFVVELLERWLARAKSGELRSVVLVGDVIDGDGPGYINAASFEDRWRMLGALEYAKFSMNHRSGDASE